MHHLAPVRLPDPLEQLRVPQRLLDQVANLDDPARLTDLAALGLSEREARSSIRLGFGRYTSEEELRTALTLIDEAARRQLDFAA